MANSHECGTVFPLFPPYLVEKYSEKLSDLGVDSGADGEESYLYIEDGCQDWDELTSILQQMLSEWTVNNPETAPKYAYIKVCYYCDKMRPDEFGGFAVFITADDIRHMSTEGWVQEQIGLLED